MNKKLVLFLTAAFAFTGAFAQQNDPVLMKINNRPVTKSEFEYLYRKNNTSSQQSLDEYLKLFTDYKLKVEEAITQGLDTMRVFTTEYNNYKNQITQPYLIDTISEQTIAKQIYDRLGENIEVSHILIRLPFNDKILPKDTLEAYEKAITVRNKLFGKKAISFENAAIEYSEDQSVQQAERPGYLGWSTALMFVSPFENGVFATPTGEISMPVRSAFGYHLIKVHNRRPDQGKVNVSHIMLGFPQRDPSEAQKDSVKKVAEDIYSKLKAGGNYADLCKEYSVDKGTSEKGGNMGWVQIGARLPQSFIDASYSLQNVGDITNPIETPFGFHIIKLEDKASRDSWEQSKKRLVEQIKSSDWLELVNSLEQDKLSKEFTNSINKDVYNSLIDLANQYFPTDSLSLDKTKSDNRNLLSIGNQSYTVADFTNYLETRGNFRYNLSTDFLSKSLDQYILSKQKDAYIASLETKYPEYKNLLREYHDGILLFNIMNDEIWDKAANDTIGLTNFFKQNQPNYKWDSMRYKGYVVFCKDEATLKAAKKLANKNKKADNLDVILKTTLNNDTATVVTVRKGVWASGENKFIDSEIFKSGVTPEPVANYPFHFVLGRKIKSPEEYTDVKGLVISDYQELKEKEWMQQLREKYPIVIEDKVLETIK